MSAPTHHDRYLECPGFCCSDFGTFIDHLYTGASDPLQNPVHQMFAEYRFSGARPGLYDATLRDACRLASRLMETDAFVRHVLTIMDGDLYLDAANTQRRLRRGRKISSISDAINDEGEYHDILVYPASGTPRKVTNDMRRQVQMILLDITNATNFAIDGANDEVCGEEAAALCTPYVDQPLNKWPNTYNHPRYAHGCRSRIVLSNEIVQPKQDDISGRHKFDLAVTILHELGHALMQARFPPGLEPFVSGHEHAEGGLALEMALFGGTIRQLDLEVPPSAHEDPSSARTGLRSWIVNFKWPSRIIAHLYNDTGPPYAMRGPAEKYDKVSAVSQQFFIDIFTERFWLLRDMYGDELDGTIQLPCMGSWIIKYRPAEQRTPDRPAYHALVDPLKPDDDDDQKIIFELTALSSRRQFRKRHEDELWGEDHHLDDYLNLDDSFMDEHVSEMVELEELFSRL